MVISVRNGIGGGVQPKTRSKRLNQRKVTSLDQRIGARLREVRLTQNLNQSKLAEMVGISFQQIQKYENGSNRVSASRLFELASALDVPLTYFFDDECETIRGEMNGNLPDAVIRVARQLHEIPEGAVRDQMFRLIKSMRRNPQD